MKQACMIFTIKKENSKNYNHIILINVAPITEWLNDNIKNYTNHVINKELCNSAHLITKEQIIRLKNDLIVATKNESMTNYLFPNIDNYNETYYKNKLNETLLRIKDLIEETNFDVEKIYFKIL